MKDRWIGWFRPLGRGVRVGPLVGVAIRLAPGRTQPRLVITVPKACGDAVRRNRFRRIVRARASAWDAELGPLWIRLTPQTKLGHHISTQDWAPLLESLRSRLRGPSS